MRLRGTENAGGQVRVLGGQEKLCGGVCVQEELVG